MLTEVCFSAAHLGWGLFYRSAKDRIPISNGDKSMLTEVWYLELGGLYHCKSDDLELCDWALIMPTFVV